MLFFGRDIRGHRRELYRQVFDQTRPDLALDGLRQLIAFHEGIAGEGKVEHGIDLFFREVFHPVHDGVQCSGGVSPPNERPNGAARYRSDLMAMFFKPSDDAHMR